MPIIEKGRNCVITKGRDAGKTVTIKEVKDKNFVIIAGEKVKERRSNVRHLMPTSQVSKSEIKAKEPKKKAEKKERPKKGKDKKVETKKEPKKTKAKA